MGLKGGISIDADSGPLGYVNGKYFDAMVVEVEKNLLFFRLALAILWELRPFDWYLGVVDRI